MDSRRIIVALDFPEAGAALDLAARLDPAACRVKVGKELFVSSGPDVVGRLRDRGFDVFVDLKFHDIPSTVAGACRAAARMGAWMVNVHASGGAAMMRAAREAVDASAKRPLLIGVTVLTSLSDPELEEAGFAGGVQETAGRLARLAAASGLDGVVCSAAEAAGIRAALGEGFVTVTPGIRPAGGAKDDQSRVATPEEAVRRGAHFLVVGRPVTRSADPAATVREMARAIADGKAAP